MHTSDALNCSKFQQFPCAACGACAGNILCAWNYLWHATRIPKTEKRHAFIAKRILLTRKRIQYIYRNGCVGLLHKLYQSGMDHNELHAESNVRIAIQNNQFRIIKYLLRMPRTFPVRMHWLYLDFDRLLINSIVSKKIRWIKYAIRHGADVNCEYIYDVNFGYGYPLYIAITLGYTHIARYLLKCGADYQNMHANEERIFIMVCQNGHFNSVKLMIKLGVDIHAQDNLAIRYAIQKWHIRIVNYLIRKGANKNAIPIQIRNNIIKSANQLPKLITYLQ